MARSFMTLVRLMGQESMQASQAYTLRVKSGMVNVYRLVTGFFSTSRVLSRAH
ncbi:MAG: hypothetical protein BWY09_02733 [Candidatus Hydrogenedentes bacterium ADurb.Bin179]|nr:MAG: hypothetical protein BWY09_02733 [Candidatus Hydrogenedentes bacterium ADurb.Bin179]